MTADELAEELSKGAQLETASVSEPEEAEPAKAPKVEEGKE